MNSQQDDSTEVKTHDEIMKLFKDLEVVEERVKNPEELIKEIIASETSMQEIEPSLHIPTEAVEEQQHIEPVSEITQDQKEKQEGDVKEKKLRFAFLKRRSHQSDLTTLTEATERRDLQEVRIPRSTFYLQLDTDGNLVGLPVKKPKPEVENKQEEEPEKGIRGKLKQIGSLFRRKSASEADSDEGIGAKIKGIFRRE